MEKTLWTPQLSIPPGGCDFEVYLDRDFATEMIRSTISPERQKDMNNMVNPELKILGINWLNPYLFYESSCFVSQIYIGNNGVWLSTDHSTIEDLLTNSRTSRNLDKPIQYSSHNVDSQTQAHTLLYLFSKWIDFNKELRED